MGLCDKVIMQYTWQSQEMYTGKMFAKPEEMQIVKISR
jgi:hypothetical protein